MLAKLLVVSALVAFVLPARASAGETIERQDLAAVFDSSAAKGTFVLYEPATDRLQVFDTKRAGTRFIPASTFKVPNSLIALETKAVKDENEIIPFGGKPQPIKEWERDMPMRDALRLSAVPIYQELARRIGLDAYRDWLARFDYGNRDPGTAVDRFWLDGPLGISAIEEAKFVARLARQELPVSKRSQGIVRDIMLLEETGGATLYGKTGWCTKCEPKVGWLVGWVARDGKVAAFALNIDTPQLVDTAKRLPLAKALLRKLEVM